MKKLEEKYGKEFSNQVVKLYRDDKYSIDDICKFFKKVNVSKCGINGLLKRSGIKIRNTSQAAKEALKYHKHSGLGKKYSIERCKKISNTRIERKIKTFNNFPIGHIPWNKGKKCPQLSGEKSHLWKGGITDLQKQIRTCLKYKIWRKTIFQRDDYTCQECKKRDGGFINADHIIMLAFLIQKHNIKNLEEALRCSELWDINNGRTLCIDCHKKTDTYTGKGRKKLIGLLGVKSNINLK
jgi:hypothetical protein